MTDYLALALQFGGYTSLDKVYLSNRLKDLSDQQKLDFITPPPSVINAYFAELYQKKSPEAATDYFLELSQALELFTAQPSFDEVKPFIRLNLSGKSYGFCFESAQLARVFPEEEEAVRPDLLFEIAQVFPHYLVYQEADTIYLKEAGREDVLKTESLTSLTDLHHLADGRLKLIGYSQEEVLDLTKNYAGQPFYRSENRTAMIYMA